MNRYMIHTPPYSQGRMEKDPTGEWVRYSETQALVEAAYKEGWNDGFIACEDPLGSRLDDSTQDWENSDAAAATAPTTKATLKTASGKPPSARPREGSDVDHTRLD